MGEPSDRDRPDELIGLVEAAGLIGVHRATLANWVRRGRIPAVRHGARGIYRVRRGDVVALMEASRLARPEDRTDPGTATTPPPGAGRGVP